MRETGPVAKDLTGDQDASVNYVGLARVLLGQMKNLMKLGGNAIASRLVTLEDGTTIRATSIHGQDQVHIDTLAPLEVVAPPPEVIEEPEIPPLPIPPGATLSLSGIDVTEVGFPAVLVRVQGQIVLDTKKAFTAWQDMSGSLLVESLPTDQCYYQAYLTDQFGVPLDVSLQQMSLSGPYDTEIPWSVLSGIVSLLPDVVPGASLLITGFPFAPGDYPQVVTDSNSGATAGFTLRFPLPATQLVAIAPQVQSVFSDPPPTPVVTEGGGVPFPDLTYGGSNTRWGGSATPLLGDMGTSDPLKVNIINTAMTLNGNPEPTTDVDTLIANLDGHVSLPSTIATFTNAPFFTETIVPGSADQSGSTDTTKTNLTNQQFLSYVGITDWAQIVTWYIGHNVDNGSGTYNSSGYGALNTVPPNLWRAIISIDNVVAETTIDIYRPL